MSDDQAPPARDDAEEAPDDPRAPADDNQPPTDVELPPAANKRWKIAAIFAVVAAALSVGALGSLLFAGSTDSGGGNVLACVPSRDFTENAKPGAGDTCPPKGAPYNDGLVEKAKGGDFTIRTIENGRLGEQLKLFVREPDRPYIDVQHAQTHAALGQPVRVFTKKHEGREIVIYMEDSPLLK